MIRFRYALHPCIVIPAKAGIQNQQLYYWMPASARMTLLLYNASLNPMPQETPRITCTRRIEFDAAHRVMEHESKCKHLHGHRYAVEATFVAADGLDTLGRVIDFGVIKEKLGAWIDANWDHTTILWDKDKPLGDAIVSHTKQAIYYMPNNPTAENMALYLKEIICPQLFAGTSVTCLKIKIFETPNCAAEAQ